MSNTKLGIGVLLIVISLILASLAFATDHWQVWMVNRVRLRAEASRVTNSEDTKKIDTEPEYFTRYIGLFRTCYPGNETTQMLENRDVVDKNCLHLDYQLSEGAQYLSDKSANYWTAIHIRRLLFALMVMGIVMLLLSLAAGTYGCWTTNRTGTVTTAVFLFLALLMLGGTIGTVFGLKYLEASVPEYRRSVLLTKYSLWSLSWSFYMLCGSTGICLIAFVFVSAVAYSLHRERVLNRRAAAKMRNYYDSLQRNQESLHLPEERKMSPLQKAVTEQNGDKMVPILMFDNAGFDRGDKNVLY